MKAHTCTGAKQKKVIKNGARDKELYCGIRNVDLKRTRSDIYLLIYPVSYIFTLTMKYITRTNRLEIVILTKKRKQHASQGDDATTAEAVPGRVGGGEQGSA